MQPNPYLEDRARLRAEVQRANRVGDSITTDCARAIAWEWHDGQGTALYAFASSGYFNGEGLLREIEAELARPRLYALYERDAQAALSALRSYVRDRRLAKRWYA